MAWPRLVRTSVDWGDEMLAIAERAATIIAGEHGYSPMTRRL
jgi:hypothetical protein